MRNRPVVIVLLALFQPLSAWLALPVSALLWNLPVPVFVNDVIAQQGIFLFGFNFVLLRIAHAYAIFAVKRWSIPFSIGVLIYDTATTATASISHGSTIVTIGIIGAHLINLVMIIYFLLPQVRALYFNRKLRWWESQPRYRINLPALMNGEVTQVLDFSRSGVLVRAGECSFQLGSEVRLVLTVAGEDYSFSGVVVNKTMTGGGAIGVQFADLRLKDRQRIRKLAQFFEKDNTIERFPERSSLFQDYKGEFKDLARGKKLVPDIQIKPAESLQRDQVA